MENILTRIYSRLNTASILVDAMKMTEENYVKIPRNQRRKNTYYLSWNVILLRSPEFGIAVDPLQNLKSPEERHSIEKTAKVRVCQRENCGRMRKLARLLRQTVKAHRGVIKNSKSCIEKIKMWISLVIIAATWRQKTNTQHINNILSHYWSHVIISSSFLLHY